MGRMPTRFKPRVAKGGFTWLLVALAFLIFSDIVNVSAQATGVLSAAADTMMLIASVYAISRHRLVLYLLLPLGVGTVVGVWVMATLDHKPMWLVIALHFSLLASMGSVLAYVLLSVVTTTHVTEDTIRGAICAYLLLAAVFSGLYSLIQVISPEDAFSVHVSMAPPDQSMTWFNVTEPVAGDARVKNELMYFSFTTMTTLGYGDIVPTTNASRSLASLHAVIGQLYLAILIARLVASSITSSRGAQENDREGSDPKA